MNEHLKNEYKSNLSDIESLESDRDILRKAMKNPDDYEFCFEISHKFNSTDLRSIYINGQKYSIRFAVIMEQVIREQIGKIKKANNDIINEIDLKEIG